MNGNKLNKFLITLTLIFFSNLAFAENTIDNYTSEEFDKEKSGGPQFVNTPKSAAKKFLKSRGWKNGQNIRENGSKFYIAIGQGSVSTTDDNQMIHDARFNAYREAIQNAKAEYVKFLSEDIVTSVSASVSENTTPDTIAEEAIKTAVGTETNEFTKLRKLISTRLDNALRTEGYDTNAADAKKKDLVEKVLRSREIKSFFTSTAQNMLGGFVAYTVFEEANPGDRSSITVIGIWSEKLAKLAEAIHYGAIEKTPSGVPKKPIREQIPLTDPAKLLQSFGATMLVNENGNMVVVGYGHSSPLFEDRADALSTACDQSENKAKQQIVLFAKENVMYTTTQNETDKAEDFEKAGQTAYRSMQSREYEKLVTSQAAMRLQSEIIDTLAIKDDRYNATDCVAIAMWSPEGVAMSNAAKSSLSNTTTGTSSTTSTDGMETNQGATGSSDF